MQAGDVELGQVFIDNHQFRIPMFQRPYVWNASKNWAPLWDDLAAAADGLLAEMSRGELLEEPPTYFLGAVVVKAAPPHPQRLGASLLVDGQQRLTTLQVLLASMRAVANSVGATSVVGRLSSWIENHPEAIHENFPDDQFKLWPLPQDRDHYLWAVRRQDDLRPAPQGDHRLVVARRWFEARINTWAGNDSAVAEERLNALFIAMSKRMKLVRIVLDKTDDMQVIFEALNHRGVELSQADLVKNLLFRLVGEQGDLAAAEDLLIQHWLELDHPRWRVDVTTGRITRSRLDVVIAYWLAIQKREVVAVENVFDEFKDWVLSNQLNAGETIKALRRIADKYEWLQSRAPDEPTRAFVDQIVATKTNTAWPLFLSIHLTEGLAAGQLQKAARVLASYLMRRRICGGTTKDYNRYFISLLSIGDGGAAVGDELEARLAKTAAETRQWPTDSEFIEALLGHNLYALTSVQLRALFAGLENYLRDGLAEDQQRVRALDATLNIEHVLPQNWRSHWPLGASANVSDEALASAQQKRAIAVNSLGNLTLTNGRLNSTMRDSAWPTKEGHLRSKSTFLITTASILSKPAGAPWPVGRAWSDEWNEENIDVRTAVLVSVALKVWPRPEIDRMGDEDLVLEDEEDGDED